MTSQPVPTVTLGPLRDGWIVTGSVDGTEDVDKLALAVSIDGTRIGCIFATAPVGAPTLEFFWPVPCPWHDRTAHRVAVSDPLSDRVLAEMETPIAQVRTYRDLDGLLDWLFHYRVMSAPFGETDMACLAYFDWLADRLAASHAPWLSKPRPANTPLVSVIMPCHDSGATVAAAVASAISQTLGDWELIVVDDGSVDETAAILAEISDMRVCCLKLPQNSGPGWARQVGLAHAAGQFVAYLDADNSWDPRFLAVMTGQLTAASDYDAAYCGQYLMRPGSETPFAVRMSPFNPALIDNENQVDINCLIHRREAAVACGGFDRDLRRLEDWDFLLRLIDAKPPLFVPVVLSRYRLSPETPDKQAHGAAAWRRIVSARERLPGAFCLARGHQRRPIWAPPPPSRSRARDVSIIIPSFEIPELLGLCVDRVFETIDRAGVEVIVCDDGSSLATRAEIARLHTVHPTLQVDLISRNEGFTHAVNRGIRRADPSNHVVLLNNDAIVTEGWLEAMLQVVQNERDVGAVVPRQMLLPGTPTALVHAPAANPHLEIDVSLSAHHANVLRGARCGPNGLMELGFAPFFCVLLSRAGIDAVGLLDERRGRHYRSDSLFCLALREVAGMRVIYTPYAKVYHLLQQSTRALRSGDPDQHRMICLENRWPELREPWDLP